MKCEECDARLGSQHSCSRSKTIKRLKQAVITLTKQLMSEVADRRTPMKKMQLEFGTDGVIRTVYQDGIQKFADDLGADLKTVCRAAHVEWEVINGEGGWTVRSAHDPRLHIRDVGSSEPEFICTRETTQGVIAHFVKRETAMEIEQMFFFKLLPPKGKR